MLHLKKFFYFFYCAYGFFLLFSCPACALPVDLKEQLLKESAVFGLAEFLLIFLALLLAFWFYRIASKGTKNVGFCLVYKNRFIFHANQAYYRLTKGNKNLLPFALGSQDTPQAPLTRILYRLKQASLGGDAHQEILTEDDAAFKDFATPQEAVSYYTIAVYPCGVFTFWLFTAIAQSCGAEKDNALPAQQPLATSEKANKNTAPAEIDLLTFHPLATALLNEYFSIKAYNAAFGELFQLQGESPSLFKHFNVKEQAKITHTLQQAKETLASQHMRAYFQGKEHQSQPLTLYVSCFETEEGTETQKQYFYLITALEGAPTTGMLEEKWEHSQKMQAVGQLAGGLAHDFNNVLTAIIMSCDLLLASHRSSDPAHADLMNIKNNATYAASLIHQLLAFSRKQTLRPEAIDLAEFFSDIRLLLARLLGPSIELSQHHEAGLWPIYFDSTLLQRVVVNLAINARDAMGEGGKLTIKTYNLKNLPTLSDKTLDEHGVANTGATAQNRQETAAMPYVVLEIADTGCGIPKNLQEKVYDPFFTTKEPGKGTGLGLAMVYGIIQQSGGSISLSSEIGQGTIFRILLPRYDSHQQENKREDIKKLSQTFPKNRDLSGSATILLVEDEDAVRFGSLRALTSRGYKVLEAASGVQALEIFHKHQESIDLVVSDVVMPEMDGPSLFAALKKIAPNIKFVFVSGYAEEAFSKNLPQNAEFTFLAKPFSLKQLAETVKETLNK